MNLPPDKSDGAAVSSESGEPWPKETKSQLWPRRNKLWMEQTGPQFWPHGSDLQTEELIYPETMLCSFIEQVSVCSVKPAALSLDSGFQCGSRPFSPSHSAHPHRSSIPLVSPKAFHRSSRPTKTPQFKSKMKLNEADPQRPASPVFSCVSMKSNRSLFEPPYMSDVTAVSFKDGYRMKLNEADPQRPASPVFSQVSMKSNRSLFEPPYMSDGTAVSFKDGYRRRIKPYYVVPERTESPMDSCVSMKSNRSLFEPPYMSNGTALSSEYRKNRKLKEAYLQRTEYPMFSCVSMKSNRSLFEPPYMSGGTSESSEYGYRMKLNEADPQRPASPVFSCVSMKSNRSLFEPPYMSDGTALSSEYGRRIKSYEVVPERIESPVFSSVSMRSNRSLFEPPYMSNGTAESSKYGRRIKPYEVVPERIESPVFSSVSMRSNRSLFEPPYMSDGTAESSKYGYRRRIKPYEVVPERIESPVFSSVSMRSNRSLFEPPYMSNGTAVGSMDGSQRAEQSTFVCSLTCSLSSFHDDLQRVKEQHKTSMKNKYENLFEGGKLQQNQTLLNSIYTQLYIIEGESEGVNEEHEVLQMEKRYKALRDTQINCNDIFNHSAEAGDEKSRERKEQIKTVLTKGIAGIGKTISVQKFILDWAEGKANQDVDFMFVLPFRELNLIKDHQCSLHTLLLDFNPELQHMNSKMYEECKVVFIFDGLDESRITLVFLDTEEVSNVTEALPVNVLMSKLIKGDLFPSALIWITTRPAAANQIPSKYINLVTEIQGFNDPQKEEYFRKKIGDKDQANRIISHIRRARSLHIMCHIPVFCWISATVLQSILKQEQGAEIPQTLTEMYIHFLLIQTHMRKQKYEERNTENLLLSNRIATVKLAKLAFMQLMKGNVMFYEEDLIESNIDVTDASVYSGICTEIFREESAIYYRKVYSFVHLSFQEFFAALYVFLCYLNRNIKVLEMFLTGQNRSLLRETGCVSLDVFLKAAMNKALKSKTGHLDLFLRFLHGISLKSNQSLLQNLLRHTDNNPESVKKIVQNLKRGQKHNISPERWMNLSHCLIEMKDNSVIEEVQAFLKSKTKNKNLSLAQCSTLANIILMSEEVLDELDFKKYNISSIERKRRLVPTVRNCRKALLTNCDLTYDYGEIVSSALQSSNSSLRELDLSHNDLQDSGVKLICAGLKSPNCRLNILRMTSCNLTEDQRCEVVSSALQPSNSSLRELDLSQNDLQDSGVKMFSAGLKTPNFQLSTLRVSGCNLTVDRCCKVVSSALQSSNSSLRELDLSHNDLQDSGVKLICAGLKSPNCQLSTLRISGCNLTDQCCEVVSLALQSSNSSLRELDLSHNDLQDSGVKLICDGLKSPNCQLNTLRLSGCMVTEKGCAALSSALTSNPSHLRELDLSYNHPGQWGLKLLSDMQLHKLNVDHRGEIRIRAGPQKYACELSLDLNTASNNLVLSEDNRKVTRVNEIQSYPDHPERFEGWSQVLCKESLTGCCYWEVQWNGSIAEISVSHKGINRKGGSEDCWFGHNEKSWSLRCSDNSFTLCHKKKETSIFFDCQDSSKTVGVFVNVSSGILSFYSVSETNKLSHLYTFNTTFTDTLHAGFNVVYLDSSVSLCHI